MKLLRWTLFVVLLAVPMNAARAQDSPDEQLFSRLSDKTFEKILEEQKLAFDRKESKVKNKTVVTYHVTFPGGLKASVINHGNMLSCWSYGFKTLNKEDISLERVNEWNKKNSYCKAHVETDGSGVLTATLDMLDGTNKKIIRGWLREFSGTLPKFAEFTK